ncbi:MAG TPA: helix-hairpin-helix domain-containing protein [Bryobacteraceae bacterium]|nr:helix-hairpin-helix domain-containing protein [Bryobacteraceae bacterium]
MPRFLFFASVLLALPATAQNLPDGPGKDLFANVCSTCHGLEIATSQKKPRALWQSTVDSMVAKGAEATKEQAAAIVNYLAKNFASGEGAATPDPVAPASAAANAMPEGPGKQIILRECTACHLPDHFVKYRHTNEEWQAIVIRMGTRVRSATKEELDTVQKYLFTNFPKVEEAGKLNVNKAGAAEIAASLGLTPEEAKAVVEYRQQHGTFREWGELLAIYGVDGRKIEAAKDRMSF